MKHNTLVGQPCSGPGCTFRFTPDRIPWTGIEFPDEVFCTDTCLEERRAALTARYVYIILTRVPGVKETRPVMASTFAIAEKWCKDNMRARSAGKALITDRVEQGITALYADGIEMYNIMAEEMIG